MFCPWDVVNFIRKNFNLKQTGNTDDIKPGNYWDNSSSDSALGEYLGYLTDSDNQKMQDLVDGKSISFQLNDSMNYDSLSEHNSDDFWSLLLHTGYLTLDWEQTKKEELSKGGKTNDACIFSFLIRYCIYVKVIYTCKDTVLSYF